MNKTTPEASRPQVWIFLGTGCFNVPDFLPRLVETLMDGIDSRVMRTHAISASGWDPVVFCELLVQRHVQLQMRYILVKVRLLMIPHVGKPRKSEKSSLLLISKFCSFNSLIQKFYKTGFKN